MMSAEPRLTTLSEVNLQLQQKSLHSHLAKINDELLKMSKITIETESAVVEATMACIEAVAVTTQVQEQLEAKRKAELEELERQKQLEVIEEEKRRAEEERLLEEERKELEIMRQRELEAAQWPWNTYVYCVAAITHPVVDYNNNNNNTICKAPECQKTSVAHELTSPTCTFCFQLLMFYIMSQSYQHFSTESYDFQPNKNSQHSNRV